MSDESDRPHAGPSAAGLPPHLDPRRALSRPARPAPAPPRAPRPQRSARHTSRTGLPHPTRRRVARVLSWVAVGLSATTLAGAGAGYALVQKYDGNIDRIGGVLGLPGVDRPADGTQESTTFLLVGSDSRAGLSAGEATQGRGEEFVTGQRADTIILAHLFADSDQAQLVSIPRDSWVTVPAHPGPDGAPVPAREAKINSSFFDGGPPLLVATVEQLTGLRVDHYVQVDFNGFTTMVDQLGGVEVCLSEPAREKDSGIDLEAGRQVVQGDQALAFVRQRKGLPRGDIDRIARQQQFLGAIIRKTLSAGTLLNPVKLNGFLDALTDSLQVDEGLKFSDLRDLALRMRNASAGAVAFTTVPVADTAARREGQSVVLVDEPAADALFDRIRRDIAPGEAEAPAEPGPGAGRPELIVPPSDIRVQVYNAAGVRGLGARAAEDLAAVGFVLADAPGNRGDGARTTTVRHGPDRADSARTLAAALPGAVVELDPGLGRTLEVLVGSGYRDAQPVTVTGAPASAPPSTPATEPQAPVVTAADDVCAP